MRMRKAVPCFLVAVGCQAASDSQAVNLDDALASMGVVLTLPPNIETIPIVEQADLDYQVAFRRHRRHVRSQDQPLPDVLTRADVRKW